MLEKYPDKSFSEIKKMIKDFAIQDSFTKQYGKNAFGYGKFNVLPLNDKPVAIVAAELTDENTVAFDASASFDPEEFPLSYDFKVETLGVNGGQKPKDYSITIEGAVLTLVPDQGVNGYYRVKLRVNDSITDSKKVYSQWILVRHRSLK